MVNSKGHRVAQLRGGTFPERASIETRDQIGEQEATLRTAREAYTSSLRVRELLLVPWKWLWLIVLVAILFTGGVVGFSMMQTPMYKASIKVLVGQNQPSNNPGSLSGEVQGLQQITQTMVEAVKTRPIAEDAIERLDLQMKPGELIGNLDAKQLRNTQFIQISYQDTSPEKAQLIANAVGDAFSEQTSEVSPSANPITATVWERATKPWNPESPNPVRDGLVALVLGAMLGVALAFLIEHLRYYRWLWSEEVEQSYEVPDSGTLQGSRAPIDEALEGKKGGD